MKKTIGYCRNWEIRMSYRKSLMLVTVIVMWVASFLPASAQLITAPERANWPLKPGSESFGTMSARLFQFPTTSGPLVIRGSLQRSGEVNFDPQRNVVIPAGKVLIGPIKLSYSRLIAVDPPPPTPIPTPPAIFTVTVFGRSPSVSPTEVPTLRQLARVSRSLGRGVSGFNFSDQINIEVKLTGALTAIEIVGEVAIPFGINSLTESIVKTVHFPSATCGEIGGDADCLAIAIQPTAIVAPNVFPLTILYEPPGNCSWANFIQTNSVGTSAVIEQSESNTEGLVSEKRNLPILPDIELFEGIRVDETNTYQEEKESSTSKRSSVFVTDSYSAGTLLGLPLPGGLFPNCKSPGGESPKGPGKGDVFVFLLNPNFLLWDTDILSNFRLAQIPAFTTGVRTVTALELAQNKIIPSGMTLASVGITLSDAGRLAILCLNPFFDPRTFFPPLTPGEIKSCRPDEPVLPFGGSSQALPLLDPSRFVCLDNKGSSPLTGGIQQSASKNTAIARAGQIRSRDTFSGSPEVREDKAVNLAVAASAGVIVGLATRDPQKAFDTFKEASDLFDKYIFADKETITTTVSLTSSTLLENAQGDEITQDFFLHDTGRFLSTRIYFDKMFGTFAFQETNAGCLRTASAVPKVLQEFINTITLAPRLAVDAALPRELVANFEALSDQTADGGVAFRLIPTAEYEVASDFIQGLPQGLHLNPLSGRLEGSLSGAQRGNYQALVSVSDRNEKEFAQLWLNIALAGDPNRPNP
jgi:hypothetical protein